MIIHNGYENLNLHLPVVTLGIFDGVHRGHRSLIDYLVLQSEAKGGESVVMTFSPHPRLVLDQGRQNLAFLTSMDEKIALLEAANVGHLIITEFNDRFSSISACSFIEDVLVKKIGTRHLIIGHNHHFGRRGEGDYNTIKNCTESMNFEIEQVQALQNEEGTISSSLIRQALVQGRLDDANSWLGYPYSLTGTVIGGRQLGRSIGFPTANIEIDNNNKLFPDNGVYAVLVKIENDNERMGMMNIGFRPTLENIINIKTLEVHVINYEGDLYNKTLKVSFIEKIREEKKFKNLDELKIQLEKDRIISIQILSKLKMS